jgi:hypothetical protein
MATPAQLLGQLAQQFEAAGNPQLANVFRGMSGSSGGGVPPTNSMFGNISVGARPPVGQLAGQLTSPMIGGRSASSFRSPLQLGPGSPVGPAATRAARSGAGMQQVLGGQLGPFGRGPRAWSEATAFPPFRAPGRPMPKRAGSSLVWSMGSPNLNPADALSRQNAALRGLSSQIGAPTAVTGRELQLGTGGGTGGAPPRVPPTSGASASGGPGGKIPPRGPNAARSAARSATAASAKSLALVGQKFAGEAYLDTHYGSMSKWAKSMRRPMDIFNFSKNRFAAIASGKVEAGGIAKMMARSPGLAAGAGMLAAPLTVGFVGDMVGVNDWFGKGTGEGRWDQAAEGLLVGASFGAVGGGPAAAISGVAGMLLNVVTNGGLVEGAQKMPLLGGSFGGDKDYINWKADALKFYQGAADAQGQPELAEQAASAFEFYAKLIEAGRLPVGSELEWIMKSGRQVGLTGPMFNAEELLPVYSADDLAAITETISEEMQPMYAIATGLMNQDFSYIEDDKIRSRLIEVSQDAAANITNAAGANLLAPTTAAIMSGSSQRQSNDALSGQLGTNDEFLSAFAAATG